MKNPYRYGKMNCDYQSALTGVCYTGMWNLECARFTRAIKNRLHLMQFIPGYYLQIALTVMLLV